MVRTHTPCSHTFLASILKLLNFLQFFVGLSMVIYSVYMLNQLNNNHSSVPVPPPLLPPSAPPPYDPHAPSPDYNHIDLHVMALPAPWFIFCFMAMGISLCCVTCIGHIAAEAINGCCLCFYTLLTTVLILLEVGLVGFIALDHHWKKDLPFDPTGELDNFHNFIVENVEICMWVGITVLAIQGLSLLISLVLRAMVSAQRENHDIENDYNSAGGKTWEPLLSPQINQAPGSNNGDGTMPRSDTWSSQIREKYGLNSRLTSHNSFN